MKESPQSSETAPVTKETGIRLYQRAIDLLKVGGRLSEEESFRLDQDSRVDLNSDSQDPRDISVVITKPNRDDGTETVEDFHVCIDGSVRYEVYVDSDPKTRKVIPFISKTIVDKTKVREEIFKDALRDGVHISFSSDEFRRRLVERGLDPEEEKQAFANNLFKDLQAAEFESGMGLDIPSELQVQNVIELLAKIDPEKHKVKGS